MDCEFRINGLCEVLQIECNNPVENDPKQYKDENSCPCICGNYIPKQLV